MKVILIKDLKGRGKKNDIITVADGYAKNFLIPNGYATLVNATNLNENAQLKNAQNYHKQVEIDAATALKNKLESITVTVLLKQGESGKAFGSVTSKEVAESLKLLNIDVDKKKINMGTIKSAGKYVIEAKLYANITAKFTLNVESEIV